MVIKVSDFVKRTPQLTRDLLPQELRNFRVFLMPWLSQVYYDDKRIHYELVKLPPRYGDNRLEVGLHFESKDRSQNERLLAAFDHYLFEVREALGDQWFAEFWDRGWTKIYTAYSYETMDDDLLEMTAQRLADAITVMEPIYRIVAKRGKR